jgi:hypothetical protein
MRFRAALFIFSSFFVGCLSLSAFAQTGSRMNPAVVDAQIIVTAAPVYQPLAALQGGERFPQGAQLLLLHAGKAEPLLAGFAATADANVSFDASSVLFSAKKNKGDPWQIWEFSMKDHSLRRLIAQSSDAIRPMYLPAGQLVFALHTANGFQLEVAGKIASSLVAPVSDDAGDAVAPLSYIRANVIPADVLLDGRILFESGYPLGAGTTPELYLVYSDGSGVESYRCDHGTARWGGKQLASGDVVFAQERSLARFTSPLAHAAPIAAPHAEYAGSLAETSTGAWLLSARGSATGRYALKQFKPGGAALQMLFADPARDLVDPVLIAPRPRPHRHPSGLHDWSFANLLALDARQSRLGDLKEAPASVRLESMDESGRVVAQGTAPVETDGSFFVSTPADRPIRFALLDGKGNVVRQEQGWFWIRRGEQRYCVGCHTGPERSSENRVPAVLLRTTTPVDLTAIPTQSAAKTQANRGSQ